VVRERCPLEDHGGWREHLCRLLNESEGIDKAKAHEILSMINDPDWTSSAGAEAWRSMQAVLQRTEALRDIINVPFTTGETLIAIKAMSNGKAYGLEPVPAECYKYARVEVHAGDVAADAAERDGPPGLAHEGGSRGKGKLLEVNYMLVPVMHALLERIRATGDFPAQFETSVLSPVFKRKGSPLDHNAYRGIAVGGALAKCYASMLMRRLVKAGQEYKLRHFCQGGFRHGFGTAHNLLVKRHLISRHQRRGAPPLIVVQIDFEKAFDKVPRELLWERLRERGFSGKLLEALMIAYRRVEMAIKVNGKVGSAFVTTQGVKQGCPLSTELFGLFIEVLADYVDAKDRRLHEAGSRLLDGAPLVDGKRVSLLLYADDASLVATSVARMKHLLRCVDEFCAAFGMKVNVAKCECMVFAAEDKAREGGVVTELLERTASLGGQRVPQAVPSARYLGLSYGPGQPFDACRKTLVDSGRGAMYSLSGKLRTMRMWAPDIRMRCFDTQVRSILSYGAEIWGPDALCDMLDRAPRWWKSCSNMQGGGLPGGPAARSAPPCPPRTARNKAEGPFEWCLDDPAVKLQLSYMRTICGVFRPCHRLLFAELAQFPMHYHWARLALTFWARVAKEADSVAHWVLKEEILLALDGWREGWAAKVLRFVGAVGVNVWEGLPRDVRTPSARMEWLLARPLPVSTIMSSFRSMLMASWDHERLSVVPTSFSTDQNTQPGIMMCRYKHWMGLPFRGAAGTLWPTHAQVHIPRESHVKLMRFRLCSWPLAANRPMRGGVRLERSERVCMVCGTNAVEDEHHVLMDCQAYSTAREASGIAFHKGMHHLMTEGDQAALAQLLASIWDTRVSKVGQGR
jgi:hypothetical protein